MSDGSGSNETAPVGYVSQESKRRFTLIAGLLGAAFLFAQFFLPMLIMFGAMATEFDSFDTERLNIYPQKAAIWDGGLYVVARRASFGAEGKSGVLLRADLDLESEPEEVAFLDFTDVELLAGDDRLWVIAKGETSFFQDGVLQVADPDTDLAEFSKPFLLDGRPAVLERWPSSLVLATFDDDGWTRGANLGIQMPDEDCGCGLDWATARADQRGLHLFLEFGSTLYYGVWDPLQGTDPEWMMVPDSCCDSSPLLQDGNAVVFNRRSWEDGGTIDAHRFVDGVWEQFYQGSEMRQQGITALSDPSSGDIFLLTEERYGSRLHVTVFDGAEVVQRRIVGGEASEEIAPVDEDIRSFMFSMMAGQYGTMILLPLLLAVILSALMRRHRVATFNEAGREVVHASLTRRAVAQLIDVILLVAPSAIGMFKVWSLTFGGQMAEVDGFQEAVGFMWPFFLGFCFAVIGFFLFAFAEGKWGVTPGKWVAGIRVLGTDLNPCGLGRALVRNLLKAIDGFFNFTVGIMVVALSENWQRVGDMAARTIVIRTRE